VVEALNAAIILEKYNISAEVIDLRTLRPLDEEVILTSVKKTGRLLALDLGWSKYGVSSEIISIVTQKIFEDLKSPPSRLGVKDTPIPSTRSLANLVYSSIGDIIDEVLNSLKLNIEIDKNLIPNIEDIPNKNFRGPF
ncbi:MAG: alpha-ketoacid dehydrogenase subunit beta, partial [Nanoarchaeota archaeon]|nr:alpha-ketoacid dehydrogenase subunit beta [Nanoarchaeota archaeon]